MQYIQNETLNEKASAVRRRRLLMRGLGILLIVLSVLVYLPLVFIATMSRGAIESETEHLLAYIFVYGTWIPFFLLLWAGWSLMSGRKYTIFFLRKFTRPDIARAISGHFELRLYQIFRLVTLEDPSFAPPKFQLRPWLITIIILGMPFLFSLAGLMIHLIGYSYFKDVPPVIFIFLIVMDMSANIFYQVFIFTIGVILFFVTSRILFRKVSLTIVNQQQLKKYSRRIQALRSWLLASTVMAPIATVIRCSDSIWKNAVFTIANACDVIVVEVSEPSENLIAEIEGLHRTTPWKVIYVGHRTELELRYKLAFSEVDANKKMGGFVQLMQDKKVLVYDDPSCEEFGSALRISLENAIAEAPENAHN